MCMGVYRPPRSSGFFEDFRKFLDEATALPGGIYICGDMNCPSKLEGHADHRIEQIIDDFDIVQHIHVPTPSETVY